MDFFVENTKNWFLVCEYFKMDQLHPSIDGIGLSLFP